LGGGAKLKIYIDMFRIISLRPTYSKRLQASRLTSAYG
jgi:hypothetical protein